MERKMRKLIVVFVVSILLLLVSCSSPDDQIPEQQISIGLSEDNIASENGNSIIGSDENTEINIVNINEALEMFSIPENISREIHVGDYVKDFPVELQDILVYCNDDINDENDNVWPKYEADCDVITPETAGDVPYEDIVSAIKTLYGASILNMQIVDIDGDGEDEYAAEFTDMKFSGLLFAKEIDGKWVIIGGDGDYTNSTKLLDLENTYYLLTENELSYWNNEIEMPDLSYWDNYGTIRHDDYWHQIGLNITVTDYTPFEVYSHERSSSIDYLANINWETLQANNAKTIDVQPSIWHDESYNHSFALCNSWEQSYEENCYLYVTASILEQYDKLGEHDKMLAVLQQTEAGTWEIIKVYYLSANYDICFTP